MPSLRDAGAVLGGRGQSVAVHERDLCEALGEHPGGHQPPHTRPEDDRALADHRVAPRRHRLSKLSSLSRAMRSWWESQWSTPQPRRWALAAMSRSTGGRRWCARWAGSSWVRRAKRSVSASGEAYGNALRRSTSGSCSVALRAEQPVSRNDTHTSSRRLRNPACDDLPGFERKNSPSGETDSGGVVEQERASDAHARTHPERRTASAASGSTPTSPRSTRSARSSRSASRRWSPARCSSGLRAVPSTTSSPRSIRSPTGRREAFRARPRPGRPRDGVTPAAGRHSPQSSTGAVCLRGSAEPRANRPAYARAVASSWHARSQRRQASAHTRQCSCMSAWLSHTSPQLLQTARQASSSETVPAAE